MDVTREVFPAVVDDVCRFVSTCDFYAVDTELSGIMVPEIPDAVIDPPERTYSHKGTAATRYGIIQFGLCTFHRSEDGKSFTARPFNFFLFPSEHPMNMGGSYNRSLERDIVLSPGAIAFNRRHKMDFQKWITHGVEYCNADQESRMQAMLEKEVATDAAKKKLSADRAVALSGLSTPDEVQYFEKCEQLAKSFMSPVPEGAEDVRPKELMLPQTRSRVAREAVQAYLEATHAPHLLVGLRGRFPTRELTLIRLSSDEMARLKERVEAVHARRLLDFVGFRRVFQAMVASKKPIVGHNCFPDLMFMLTAFDAPLPLQSLAAFKAHYTSLFPVTYDTKTIATDERYFAADRFDQKSLEPLYQNYKASPLPNAPVITLPIGFQAYNERTLLKSKQVLTGAAHEAGFDALMTGVLLLNLLTEAKLLGAKAPLPAATTAAVANRLNQHRGLYTLNLDAADPAAEVRAEGGLNDMYKPRFGAVLISYDEADGAHVIDSRMASLGYLKSPALEVVPGLSLVVISDVAAAAIAERAAKRGISASDYSEPKPSAKGEKGQKKKTQDDAPPKQANKTTESMTIAALAAAEINQRFEKLLVAEVFTPYHLRPRDPASPPGTISHPCTATQLAGPVPVPPPMPHATQAPLEVLAAWRETTQKRQFCSIPALVARQPLTQAPYTGPRLGPTCMSSLCINRGFSSARPLSGAHILRLFRK